MWMLNSLTDPWIIYMNLKAYSLTLLLYGPEIELGLLHDAAEEG